MTGSTEKRDKRSLELLAEELTRRMERHEQLDEPSAIAAVRLSNTISQDSLEDDSPAFRKFEELFWSDYLEDVAKQLGSQLTKGMAYYSPRHDIYIGGRPHANSRFEVAA
jgi:hypothetical protein